MAQTGNRMQHGKLHILRHGRGKPLHIPFDRIQSFRFKEELMAVFIRKAHDLILDRGAVACARSVNRAGIHRRTMDVFADDAMRFFVGIGQVAHGLVLDRVRGGKLRHALAQNLPSVTLVHKGNIMKFTEGAFRQHGYDVAKEEFAAQTVVEAEAASAPGKLVIKDRIADAKSATLRPLNSGCYFTNKDFPVISAGCSIPINSMSVGMISAKHPFSRNL